MLFRGAEVKWRRYICVKLAFSRSSDEKKRTGFFFQFGVQNIFGDSRGVIECKGIAPFHLVTFICFVKACVRSKIE